MSIFSLHSQLHPLLWEGERPNVKTLQEDVVRVIGSWLKLSPNEEEYVERLQRGELMPDLLFPQDREMADRLQQHPALLWKAKNAQLVSHRAAQRISKQKPANS